MAGEILRKDEASFEKSRVKELQEFLCGFYEGVQKLLSEYKVEYSSHFNSGIAFVALAAPSLVGKTQVAFTIDDSVLRFLYFPLNTTQPIYQCFSHLKDALFSSIDKDLRSLGINPKVTNRTERGMKMLDNIHTDKLRNDFICHEFWVLGLWKAIICESERCKVEKGGWLKKLSSIVGLNFKQETIDNFTEFLKYRREPLKFKYALFIDEFFGDHRYLFVRNLAGAAGLRCVTSSANVDAVNLIGGRSYSSGGSYLYVWSLVVNKLDSANIKVLNEMKNFSSLLSDVSETIESQEATEKQNEVDNKNIFVDHLTAQVYQTSPGIAFAYVAALEKLAEKKIPKITLQFALDFLKRDVSEYLSLRKEAIGVNPGRFPKLGSYKPGSFVLWGDYTVEEKDTSSNKKVKCSDPNDFLSEYLDYLHNPAKEDEWKFLTIERGTEVCRINYIGKDGGFTHTFANIYYR